MILSLKFSARWQVFTAKLHTVPLLGVLVTMVTGVVVGNFVTGVPVWLWVVFAAICGGVAALTIGFSRVFSTVYVLATVVFFGAALACWQAPQSVVPQGVRVWMEVDIEDDPVWRGGRAMHTSGRVVGWREEGLGGGAVAGVEAGVGADVAGLRPSGERLLLAHDTMWRFAAGDRVFFRGYVNRIDTVSSSYARLMWARGYTGRTYISQYSRPQIVGQARQNFGLFFKKLQASATSRLLRLEDSSDAEGSGGGSGSADGGGSGGVSGSGTGGGSGDDHSVGRVSGGGQIADALAIAAAMTTGDRSGITPELRQAYSRTGAAHLLAVSGLHVGIIFVVINVLLYLLPLFRGGFFVKNTLAVVAIWAYAALTGLSPSVVRAAVMFTGAQLAVGLSVKRSAANILCGTAVVMLAVRPSLVFDISFQLSFIAVAGIMAWFPALYRLVESRFKALNALWGVIIVGLAASVATMPLVSHTFGVFSPLGVVLNPIVIATAHLVIVFSVVWIIAPVAFLAPFFRLVIGGSAWLQNTVVEVVSSVPGVAVEWTLSAWGVAAIYGIMIIFTAWLTSR